MTLFSTRGMSLKKWDEVGMFGREVSLYRKLQDLGVEVGIVTYGDKTELDYQKRIPGIKILFNRWHLPRKLYEILMPRLYGQWFKTCDLVKSNQTNGADVSLRVARFWNLPFISRCGFMWSRHMEKQWGKHSLIAKRSRKIEERVFSSADKIVVTAGFMMKDVVERLPATKGNVNVIPNYVETERFKPQNIEKDIDLLFVGRLVEQKNVFNLLEAISTLNCTILMVGNGNLQKELFEKYGEMDGRITRLDNIPNSELQNYYNRTKIYIQPSLYEGHPKTLIEAMSCGCAVLGSNSPGIREVLKHDDNGWMCELDATSIREGIQKLLSDNELRIRLGENARVFIKDNYDLDKIVDKEIALYRELVSA